MTKTYTEYWQTALELTNELEMARVLRTTGPRAQNQYVRARLRDTQLGRGTRTNYFYFCP